MRPALLLLCLSGLLLAEGGPPLANVSAQNAAAAAALDGYFDANHSSNATAFLRFGSYSQEHPVAVSVLVLELSPSLDGVSCSAAEPSVIFARGLSAGHLTSLPSEGYPDFPCDRAWFEESTMEYAWRCDFDGDNCAEYENRTYADYSLNVTFAFRNVSESVPFSSTLMGVPANVSAAMADASGAENLTVSINGTVRVIYEINDRSMDFDCHDNFTQVEVPIHVQANASFRAGGAGKLFFLRAPILREQWYRNNRFDVIALSQCPLYSASISLNNGSLRNITLRTFNITTDEYNISRLESAPAPGGGWSESSAEPASPIPLEAGASSYLYAYEFNSTYAGLGENNLSLSITDAAMQNASFNDTLLSRMLTHSGNISENGGEAPIGLARPSIAPGKSALSAMDVGVGLLGLLIILMFVNFWVPR